MWRHDWTLPAVRAEAGGAGALQRRTDTWHDDVGRIVFTAATGLPAFGLSRKADPKDTSYTLQTPTSTQTGLSLPLGGHPRTLRPHHHLPQPRRRLLHRLDDVLKTMSFALNTIIVCF